MEYAQNGQTNLFELSVNSKYGFLSYMKLAEFLQTGAVWYQKHNLHIYLQVTLTK